MPERRPDARRCPSIPTRSPSTRTCAASRCATSCRRPTRTCSRSGCRWSCSRGRRSARSASCTSPTGSSSTGPLLLGEELRLSVSVQRRCARTGAAARSTSSPRSTSATSSCGRALDEPQARRRRRVASRDAWTFEDPPVTAAVAAAGRPRPPLRRRLRRPQPDPPARAGARSRSASSARSPTACGRRRAAWRRCGYRTRSRPMCASRSRSCCREGHVRRGGGPLRRPRSPRGHARARRRSGRAAGQLLGRRELS